MDTLGEAFDCAVNRRETSLQAFFGLFVASGVARAFGSGAPRYTAGASLRAIQQYEQRHKNINHAHGVSLYALARALGCCIEDLFEYPL